MTKADLEAKIVVLEQNKATTKESAEKRLVFLEQQAAKQQENVNQALANLHAFEGAIIECKFWISQL